MARVAGIWWRRICWRHSISGHIAGAALDVFEPEPLPAGKSLLVAPQSVSDAACREHHHPSERSATSGGEYPNMRAGRR
jgi:hypothetical protein